MDFTYHGAIMIVLASLEVLIGILAVSMPVFWPLIEAQFHGIVVQQEVRVTSRHVSDFDELEDGDAKSEHGSETALGPERSIKGVKPSKGGKAGYFTQDLELDTFSSRNNNVTIGARRGSHGGLPDTTTYERLR